MAGNRSTQRLKPRSKPEFGANNPHCGSPYVGKPVNLLDTGRHRAPPNQKAGFQSKGSP